MKFELKFALIPFLAICISTIAATSGYEELSGRVTDASGAPLSGATVDLLSSGYRVLSDADGKFSFGENSPIRRRAASRGARQTIRIAAGAMILPWEDAGDVRMALHTVNGRKIAEFTGEKVHRVNLNTIIPTGSAVVATIAYGSQVHRARIIKFGTNNFALSANAITGDLNSLATTGAITAAVDSLMVVRYGYEKKIVAVEDFATAVEVKLDAVSGEIIPPGMKKIEGGTYLRGSENGQANETPVKEITITGFYMDSTEVTQADYYSLTGERPWMEIVDEYGAWMSLGETPLTPAWYISWNEAVLYCNKRSKREGLDTVYSYTREDAAGRVILNDVEIEYDKIGYRLPTEAEWEYAARAGATTEYYWGDEVNDETASTYEWYNKNAKDSAFQVATKMPNPFGLYDMLGNVSEFCNDFYSSLYYQFNSEIENPIGPEGGDWRTTRGGSCMTRLDHMRCARRGSIEPNREKEYTVRDLGLRVVCPDEVQ